MAKRTRKRKTKSAPRQMPRQLRQGLETAYELNESGEQVEAMQILRELERKYPRSRTVLDTALYMAGELKDWHSMAYYGEKLYPLEHGEERAATLSNMVLAYMQLMSPALAWQTTQILIADHPDFDQIEDIKQVAEATRQFLRDESMNTFSNSLIGKKTEAEQLDLFTRHERIRFWVEGGHTDEAIEVAQLFLNDVPDFVPVLNNLSLAYALAGKTQLAIDSAEYVLELVPDNVHALGNLVRFYYLSGQIETATSHAQQLKQIDLTVGDAIIKCAEAFAIIGDDDTVCAIYTAAKNTDFYEHPLLQHLAATAFARLGNENKAWELWRKSARNGIELAQGNLDDRRLPVGQRHAPWYYTFRYWFSAEFLDSIQIFMPTASNASERVVQRAAQRLLALHPYLPTLFPHILERGDKSAREFVINFIKVVETPELLEILLSFALDRHGSDSMRMNALSFISNNHKQLLVPGSMVTMWIDGKQSDLQLMGWEIYTQAEGNDLDGELYTIHEQAYDLIEAGQYDEAEPLLQQLIASAPDFPSAYNQLALVYEKQGQSKKAYKLIEETHERFPDYSFARIALARRYAGQNRVDDALDMLDPVRKQERMHVSEFRALSQAEIDIALQSGQVEAAQSWLNMWEQIENHPQIAVMQRRIDQSTRKTGGLSALWNRK